MTSKTLGDLKSRIQIGVVLGQTQAAPEMLTAWAVDAYERVASELKYLRSVKQATLIENVQTYSIPDDCAEVLWVQWYDRDLIDVDIREINVSEAQGVGNPAAWARFGDNIWVAPVPNILSVAHPLTVGYVNSPPTLTADTDVIPLPDMVFDVLVADGRWRAIQDLHLPGLNDAIARAETLIKDAALRVGAMGQLPRRVKPNNPLAGPLGMNIYRPNIPYWNR
jgi:hypothetical protein